MQLLENYFHISNEVQDAILHNRPVVALESTIISHGMPYPQNVETALLVEKTIRDHGAVPATIAILGGKMCVGISAEQINHLGKKGLSVTKASRRDLPILLSKGEDGATTVATTMIAAALAEISIFATGGIGGVHRGAEINMDISADLEELSQTDVSVVCAGAKSILDLGLTLEYLETKGVPVIGYQTDELPAFYCRKSGFSVDYRLDTPAEIAAAIKAKAACGLQGGMLITNPISEADAMPEDKMCTCIDEAVQIAAQQGIKGKEITPFLLDRIQTLTAGKSLQANIQLILNNAKLGAQIAKELCALRS